MQEKYWFLKNCRLLERLDPSQLAWLETRCQMKRFAKNTNIYLPADQSDGVMLLAEGRVKICCTAVDGKQGILTFINPGELFGELSLFHAATREEFAEAAEPSTVILIPADAMNKVIGESPNLAMGISRLVGLRRRRIERRLKYLLFHSNRDRIISLLLELAEDYGIQKQDEVELKLKLSHQDLASIIGSTRESVTVILGKLQSEGLIRLGRRKISVCDLAKLAACVSVPPPPVARDMGPNVSPRPLAQTDEERLQRDISP